MAAALLGFAHGGDFAAHALDETPPQVTHAAARALVGNTLVYAKPDQPGRETGVFLRLDGTGQAVTRGPDGAGEARAIRWANLSDGTFCVTDAGRPAWDGDCGKLLVAGTLATLTPASGPVWSGRVLEGDAWKLDPASASSGKLSGRAAIRALVGHTLVFTPEGGGREYRAHYFMADGTVRRAHSEEPRFDHWVLQPDEKWSVRGENDQLCLGGGAWKTDFCVDISIVGDLVTLREEKIGPLHATRLQGDARNLSPAAEAAVKAMADALVDNTLLLKAADRQGDTDSVIYFQRGGTGRAKWRSAAPGPIKWLIRLDGNLCVAERQKAFQDNECAKLSVDGDAVTLAAPDRFTIPGRILKGNALKM